MRTEQPPAGEPLLPAALAGLAALFVSLLAGAVFSPVHDPFGLENVTIVYMAVVAIAAIAGGTYGGLLAALVASLSYNFFFTTPYRTLRIDSVEQVMTVVLLFVAGVVISLATNAIRGRLVGSDTPAAPSPGGDADELIDAVARASGDGTNAASVAVHGLQRLYDAQWVALIPFDDIHDRALVWAGDLPTPAERAEETRSQAWNGRLGHRPPPGIGSAAHVFVDAEHPAVLVVMPRPGRPLTHGMHATMLGVARALEADVALPA
jgi:hypothetical protein